MIYKLKNVGPMKVMLVLGARPQIIKSAPIIHAAKRCTEMDLEIVHTGQHYDYQMSKIFFKELDLPDPIANLEVGSGSHAWQTGEMMIRLERVLVEHKPDFVLVPGDTNSTLAGALSSAKLHIPVGHVEAGARSYDMRMPEEINRRLTDHCSTLLFAPTKTCAQNLSKEGVPDNQVFQTGDTMYDALLQHLGEAMKSNVLHRLGIEQKDYALLTMHRPENVDDPRNLKNIVDAIIQLKDLTIVFPVHPRTKERLRAFDLHKKVQEQKHIKVIQPVSYHDTIKLIKNARMVFTDSGGMQKEAFWLHTPCITLRTNTEWIETVKLGANYLVGANTPQIIQITNRILGREEIHGKLRKIPNPFGGGKASEKIIDVIKESLIKS